MIRISIPFLFMIYDSSSIPISDFCICSYFRIFHIFTNLLYTKNLTNLTNLTILQILQPYNLFVDECRTMCRHISYDLLTPGVAAAPRHGRVETQPRLSTSGRNPGSPQRCVPSNQPSRMPAYQPHHTPTQQSLNRIVWRNPGSQNTAAQGFYYVSSFTLQEPRQQAEQSHGRHAHHHAW